MAVSRAHINATNKYNKEHYKKIQANIKPEDYEKIDEYCKRTGISKATLIVKGCEMYMNSEDTEK